MKSRPMLTLGQHYTDATDTRALAFVISAINDVIIQGELIFPFTCET